MKKAKVIDEKTVAVYRLLGSEFNVGRNDSGPEFERNGETAFMASRTYLALRPWALAVVSTAIILFISWLIYGPRLVATMSARIVTVLAVLFSLAAIITMPRSKKTVKLAEAWKPVRKQLEKAGVMDAIREALFSESSVWVPTPAELHMPQLTREEEHAKSVRAIMGSGARTKAHAIERGMRDVLNKMALAALGFERNQPKPEIRKHRKCVREMERLIEIGARYFDINLGTSGFLINKAANPLPTLTAPPAPARRNRNTAPPALPTEAAK